MLTTLAMAACEAEDQDSNTDETQSYIGKTALLGITYENLDGSIRSRVQVYGTVIGLDEAGGLIVRPSDGGEDFIAPPYLEPADPGEYRLKETGEVVIDPDFIGTWISTPPDDSNSP